MTAGHLVRLVGLAWLIGLLPLAATAVQPGGAAETVENAIPETPSAPATPSNWSAPEELLHDNGPMITHPGGGAGGADASALQSALGMNTYGIGHQALYDYRIADQFEVTDPGGWDIDTITFFAYQTNSPTDPSPITAVNYVVWDGVPGAPGSSILFGDYATNRLISSAWSNIYRVLDTALTNTTRPIMADTVSGGFHLDPGTYWLDWQSDGSLSSGPWAPPITLLGQTTTGDGLQSLDGGATWAAALDTGTNTPQGLPFIIEGSIPGPGEVFAYINQPWDWVDGITSPGATVDATLTRGGVAIAIASTSADAQGVFSLHFASGGNHIDLLVGDEVTVSGGSLNATLTLIDIDGSIDVGSDLVTGQASGGVFPTQGVASVGWPSDLSFTTQPFDFADDGSFMADFGGLFDIDVEHLAKVNYTDPNGNMVVQLFSPESLDIRARISEGFIEGVTTPGETVSVLVSDEDGPKGTATVQADATGFYSTPVYDRGVKVRLELGDLVEVKNSQHARAAALKMFHVSYVQPWNDRVVGTILGINFPPEGTMGRVDLWSVAEQEWIRQYVGIGPDGTYGADFDGVVDVTIGDVARVWAATPDGNQQAALGWALDLGASLSDDEVWGYTTVSSTVYINLYRELSDSTPVGLIGTATTVAQTSGFFSTRVFSNSLPVDIAPTNVVQIVAGAHLRTLYVGLLEMSVDVEEDRLTIGGPPNAVMHIEARRRGVLREDAPYQPEYAWREITLNASGSATVDLAPYDLASGDWVDLTAYGPEVGAAVHTLLTVPGVTGKGIYLPMIKRTSP